MKNIFLSIIFLLISFCLYSQKTLIIEKVGSKKKMYYLPGDDIKLKLYNPDTTITGNVTWINDSAFMLNGYFVIRLSNVAAVKKSFHYMKTLTHLFGYAFIGYFGVTTINGIVNHEQVFKQQNLVISGILLASTFVAASFSTRWVKPKGRWRIIVLDRPVHYK